MRQSYSFNLIEWNRWWSFCLPDVFGSENAIGRLHFAPARSTGHPSYATAQLDAYFGKTTQIPYLVDGVLTCIYASKENMSTLPDFSDEVWYLTPIGLATGPDPHSGWTGSWNWLKTVADVFGRGLRSMSEENTWTCEEQPDDRFYSPEIFYSKISICRRHC